jgi:hypothetical protein
LANKNELVEKLLYNIIFIIIIIGLFAGVWAIVFFLIFPDYMPIWIFPANNVSVDVWLSVFQKWYIIFLSIIFAIIIIWYLLGSFFSYPEVKYARLYWYIFFFTAVAVSIAWPTILIIRAPLLEGVFQVFIIFVISGIGLFYISTLFLSPASFKYATPLSSVVRKW